MGPFQMSSRKPVSTARPQTFWSMEYGEDLVTSIGSACSAANAIALSRVMPESRTGASTRRSGASAPKPTSKRTWSLPLPVQPWASALAHGCTGKGNDQVRFEVGFGALAPDLRVLAPVRDSGMTRDKAIAFAAEQALPIDVTKSSPYSIDQNVWGRAVETGFLEDIWNGPIEDVYSY